MEFYRVDEDNALVEKSSHVVEESARKRDAIDARLGRKRLRSISGHRPDCGCDPVTVATSRALDTEVL